MFYYDFENNPDVPCVPHKNKKIQQYLKIRLSAATVQTAQCDRERLENLAVIISIWAVELLS